MIRLLPVLWLLLLTPLCALEEGEIAAWINARRMEGGLNALEREGALERSARSYGAELIGRGLLTHRDREGQGPGDRYSLMGGTALAAGEILGTCSSDSPPALLEEAWWNSPEHRKQILDPRWTCLGVGWAEREGVLIVCVEFSSSLLTEYSMDEEGESLSFRFTPLAGADKLIFTERLTGQTLDWERGKEPFFLLDRSLLPALLEIRGTGEYGTRGRGNRMILENRERDQPRN